MARDRSLSGPLVLSFLLHAGVLSFGLIAGLLAPAPKPVTVTPVTLLTSAELARLMAASQSKEPQTAQTPEPIPEAAPEAPAPPAPPTPAPPKAMPSPPAPKLKAAEPAPKAADKAVAEKAPAAKAQPKSSPEAKAASRPLDLNALAQSIKNSAPAAPPRSAAPKGPTRAEIDLQAREAEGAVRAIRQFNLGVADQLGRAWRPNCGVEGAANLRVLVRIALTREGRLISAELPEQGEPDSIRDPVLKAAALRALSAVAASSPYRNLPPVESYDQWRTILITFDGRTACS